MMFVRIAEMQFFSWLHGTDTHHKQSHWKIHTAHQSHNLCNTTPRACRVSPASSHKRPTPKFLGGLRRVAWQRQLARSRPRAFISDQESRAVLRMPTATRCAVTAPSAGLRPRFRPAAKTPSCAPPLLAPPLFAPALSACDARAKTPSCAPPLLAPPLLAPALSACDARSSPGLLPPAQRATGPTCSMLSHRPPPPRRATASARAPRRVRTSAHGATREEKEARRGVRRRALHQLLLRQPRAYEPISVESSWSSSCFE